ncbi:hypothetical protein E1B28_012063 [Marasmius oreades]|uniref:Uncharacterized protein n=1 Tax=Marasmius oreades TaxID=181124 RepID=A0A9P7RRP7_9AGAR|nr:uncharacterized protein E1B28_012063 [Marasmius oreades]KAG7088026.1 hypothetical protein E1B28_012063 [Marasmius oreades]
MVSLETLTPFQDKPIEPRQFQLISLRSFTVAMYICHFEWIFGLEYGSFPYNSELNTMLVSNDIREYLEEGSLIFIPTAGVMEKAYDMMIYNDNRSREPDERKRFEEFGTGPWEYTILPGRWDRKTKKIRSLPPLFNRSPDGNLTPFPFEDCDYDALPRFTSFVHPLIVIMLNRINMPNNHPASMAIQEKLIAPLKKVLRKWPQWQHNRFLPMPNTKFKREYDAGQKIICHCTFCSKNGSSTSTASSPELADTCTDDAEEVEEESRMEEYKELSRIANERIAVWRGCLEGVVFIHGDVEHDGILDRYGQECTDAADKVMLRQEEERAKREKLAAKLQGDFPLNKKSRLS